jgi:pimeloyl-ACP methyl ester carboxylesterase
MATVSAGAGDACQFSLGSIRIGELKTEFLHGGKGSPLLYLHGLSRPLGWDTDHIGLALLRHVYAPVLPGWKAGRFPPQIKSIQDYARLMLAFLDAEKIEKTDVVGHSIGGWIALYLALLAPARVGSLILVDSMGLDSDDVPATDISAFNENALYNAVFSTRGVLVAAGDFGGVPLDLRGGTLFKHILNGQRNMIALAGGKCGETSLTPLLQNISADTLIVWGDADFITPLEQAKRLCGHIRGSRLIVIENAGHIPQKEKPQTFLCVLCNFLSRRREPVEGTYELGEYRRN